MLVADKDIKIVYIAGPMTGMKDWNREAFELADVFFSAQGYTVLNPARNIPLHEPDNVSHSQYMMIALAMLSAADAMVLLWGWRDSKGAVQEYAFAKTKGIPVYAIKEGGGVECL